jgi:hypothetical protein
MLPEIRTRKPESSTRGEYLLDFIACLHNLREVGPFHSIAIIEARRCVNCQVVFANVNSRFNGWREDGTFGPAILLIVCVNAQVPDTARRDLQALKFKLSREV